MCPIGQEGGGMYSQFCNCGYDFEIRSGRRQLDGAEGEQANASEDDAGGGEEADEDALPALAPGVCLVVEMQPVKAGPAAGHPRAVGEFEWSTAGSRPERDPVRWVLEGADRVSGPWRLLHAQVRDVAAVALPAGAGGHRPMLTAVPHCGRCMRLHRCWRTSRLRM